MPDPRHIHLIAICGVGMSALAGMLQTCGFRVTGSGSERLSTHEHAIGGAGNRAAPGDFLRITSPTIRISSWLVMPSRSQTPKYRRCSRKASPFSPSLRPWRSFFWVIAIRSWSRARTARRPLHRSLAWVLESAGLTPAT